MPKANLAVKNPFSLTAAAKFGALFAVVLLAVKIVQKHPAAERALRGRGPLRPRRCRCHHAVDGGACAKSGQIRTAVIAITIAALSNTLVKCGMVLVLAGLALGKPS